MWIDFESVYDSRFFREIHNFDVHADSHSSWSSDVHIFLATADKRETFCKEDSKKGPELLRDACALGALFRFRLARNGETDEQELL